MTSLLPPSRSNPPVITHLRGGVGNQLFQLAVGRAVSRERAAPLWLDLRSLRADRRRPYGLSGLLEPDDFLLQRSASWWLPRPYSRIPVWRQGIGTRITEAQWSRPLPAGTLWLDDFWQAWSFVAGAEDAMLAALDRAVRSSAPGLVERIRAPRSAVLHVRRGDYVSSPVDAERIGALGKGYYLAALERLRAAGASELFAFSDDPAWVHREVAPAWPGPVTVVGPADLADDRAALAAMSVAPRIAVSNSSFSWWAAFPVTQRGGDVIAPAQWFRSGEPARQGMIHDSWTVLDPGFA